MKSGRLGRRSENSVGRACGSCEKIPGAGKMQAFSGFFHSLSVPAVLETSGRCKTDGGKRPSYPEWSLRTASRLRQAFVLLLFLLFPHLAYAQNEPVVNQPLALIIMLAAISLAPFILIMVTSFVKISVVLSIVRQALGTQQIPPNQVINGLAIILTIYIMYPIGLEIKQEASALMEERTGQPLLSDATTRVIREGANVAKEPLRRFLIKHAHSKDRVLFYGLAKKMRSEEAQKDLTDEDLIVVIPAFVISELKEAFQIGFLIFVPFIVIDMVVSNILLAMGMMMLSPTTISLPFKLLLFILIDGWYLIARGLVLGYVPS